MKVRNGFVSNSSSTSFMIKNISDRKKTLVDFVEENPDLVEQFNSEYDDNYTQEEMLESAEGENYIWDPGESNVCIFGDEQGTVLGRVLDYILRDGGKSESFVWEFHEWHR